MLEGLEPVRLRPGMYIGSTGPRGLHHLVYEVVDNAVDEALAGPQRARRGDHPPRRLGHGPRRGPRHPGRRDGGQGLSALTVVLTKLHAGGKFGGDGYKVSGGLHGVGVSVVNALSEWLVAEVRRDGKVVPAGVRARRPAGRRRARSATRRRPGRRSRSCPTRRSSRRPTSPPTTLIQRLRETAFLTRGLRIVLRRRARRGQDGRVPLRGRDPGLRRLRERVEGPGPQARRLLRGRERGRAGRGRDAVEHVLPGVRLLVRQQHQHARGRHPHVRASAPR